MVICSDSRTPTRNVLPDSIVIELRKKNKKITAVQKEGVQLLRSTEIDLSFQSLCSSSATAAKVSFCSVQSILVSNIYLTAIYPYNVHTIHLPSGAYGRKSALKLKCVISAPLVSTKWNYDYEIQKNNSSFIGQIVPPQTFNGSLFMLFRKKYKL